jgi:hypothetical protein
MYQITLNIEESRYAVLIQFLSTLDYVKITQSSLPVNPQPKYDFSDLVGKLEWAGDAVAEQKRLRDEW